MPSMMYCLVTEITELSDIRSVHNVFIGCCNSPAPPCR
jgi:hypothetical protein